MEELLTFQPQTQIACGAYHTAIATTDGRLYTCGQNVSEQLGLGTEIDYIDHPTPVPRLESVEFIATGNSHTIVVTISGQIFVCGANYYDQLGTGDNIEYSKFVPVRFVYPVKTISTEMTHTALVTTEGHLYTCGSNNYGQLGTGDRNDQEYFTWIDLPNLTVESVAVGSGHTALMTSNGRLYTCGHNEDGQLGTNDYQTRISFVPIGGLPLIGTISARDHSTGVVTRAGELYMCGNNLFGQLGLGDQLLFDQLKNLPTTNRFLLILTDDPVKSVSVGSVNTAVITDTIELFMTGSNLYGQFGVEQPRNSTYFIQVGDQIKTIANGYAHTLILTTNDQIYATGQNSFGQLGVGDERDRHQFTKVVIE